MAENEDLNAEADELAAEVSTLYGIDTDVFDALDEYKLEEDLYYIWTISWANFTLEIQTPKLAAIEPAVILLPEKDEEVYRIIDGGYRMNTSRDDFPGNSCTGKYLNTVKKMIRILTKRILDARGAGDATLDVFINFSELSHPIGHRIGYETFQELLGDLDNVKYHIENLDLGDWPKQREKTKEQLEKMGLGAKMKLQR